MFGTDETCELAHPGHLGVHETLGVSSVSVRANAERLL